MQVTIAFEADIESSCCAAELSQLLSPKLFKALAEPNRLAILLELAGRGCECTVGEIGDCCPRDLSVVSRHLSCLREAGILESQKHGKEVRYRLAPGLSGKLRAIADALDDCCPPTDDEPSCTCELETGNIAAETAHTENQED